MTAIAVAIHVFRTLRTVFLFRAYPAEYPRCELLVVDIDASGLEVQRERVTGIGEQRLGDE
jgi:hypothetical protein